MSNPFDDFDHPDRSTQTVNYVGNKEKKITIDNLDTLRMFSPGYKITHWAFDDSTNQINEVEDGFFKTGDMVLGIGQDNPQEISDPEKYTITTENGTKIMLDDWLAFEVIKDLMKNKLPEETNEETKRKFSPESKHLSGAALITINSEG